MKILHDKRFHNRGLHNFNDNLTQPRHRWYPFKEGFSAELVSQAIRSVKETGPDKPKILDPFSGSGTTPVTAALNGFEAHAIEVNPFCSFASRVKCSPRTWRKKSFGATLDKVIKRARKNLQPSGLERQSTFSQPGGREKWLFNTLVLRAFAATSRTALEMGATYNRPLQLAALRAAMACCNAKKDGKALRYFSDWKERAYSADDFFKQFHSFALQFREDTELATIRPDSTVRIRTGDCRRAMARLPDCSFDLLVTSPPYLNSLDYCDVYRPELFLGGFVSNNLELRRIRLRTMRSHLQVKWGGPTSVDSKLLAAPLEHLRSSSSLWNKSLPEMVEAYFHDMLKVLRQAARVLKPRAQAWIVASTSAYAGIQIPVDLILAELATSVGFDLEGVYVLRSLRAAGQQQTRLGPSGHPLRESLIVLVRSAKRNG